MPLLAGWLAWDSATRAAANIINKEVMKSKGAIKQWNKEANKNGELGLQAYGCLVLTEQHKIKTLEKLVKTLREEANKDYYRAYNRKSE